MQKLDPQITRDPLSLTPTNNKKKIRGPSPDIKSTATHFYSQIQTILSNEQAPVAKTLHNRRAVGPP